MQAGRSRPFRRPPAAPLALLAALALVANGATHWLTPSDEAGERPIPPEPASAAQPAGADSARSAAPGPAPTTVPPCEPAPLAQRAAAVLVVGLPDVTDPSDPLVADITSRGVGGVLLTGANVVSQSQVAALVSELRRRSARSLLVTTDEETGRVSSFAGLFGATRSARRLATESTPAAVRELAREIGATLATMGVDLNLAPVVDLDDGPFSGIVGDRSFSAEPAVVSEFALAFATGMADARIRTAAKHFPGHGPATGDDHTGRVTAAATLDQLMGKDVKPFVDMVKAGIPVVMMANVDYAALDPEIPASLSPKAYQLLRQTGFRGVAITDSVGMGAVNQRWDVAEAAVAAVKAGADGVLLTDGSMAKYQIRALVDAVLDGVLDEGRLNQAAARMTALAGGDPMAFACQAVTLPTLASAA